MVKNALALLALLFSSTLLEVVGTAALTAAAWGLWGWEAGVAVIGVALLLKSVDLDLGPPTQ